MSHQDMLDFPDEDVDWTISEEAKDLIRRLICPREVRLGKGGFADFRDHPFFAGVDWATIRDSDPPYHPEVSSPTDTSNFDVDICEDDFTPCILKTRLADETASKERAATAKDPDVEDLEKKVRELKEKNRQLILEKTELQR
ncbi:hypothetical protein TELCIR_19408, partial [Teladorsagia circumcincta]